MPFGPSGIYSLPPEYRAEPGAVIRVQQHNPPLEDIAQALSLTMVRDGRSPMIGPLNMNGFPIIGLPASNDPSSTASVAQTAPIGSVVEWAGSAPPVGWLLCDGSAVSRTLYPLLFSAIGTKFGAGDGSTTFNLPDARGRVSAGRDNMGGTAAGRLTTFNATAVGATGGGEATDVLIENLPDATLSGTAARAGAHRHGGNTAFAGSHNHSAWTAEAGHHSHTGATSFSGDHSHSYTSPGEGGLIAAGGASARYNTAGATTGAAGNHQHSFTTDGAGNHTHPVGIEVNGNHNHSFTTDPEGDHTHSVSVHLAGGRQPLAVVQPTIIFDKIIRATYGAV